MLSESGEQAGSFENLAKSDFCTMLEAAKRGNQSALKIILTEFHDRLLARIERRLPLDLRRLCWGDDVLAEALADAARGLSEFVTPADMDPRNAFFRWLCSIAEHRLIDLVRSERAIKRPQANRQIDPKSGSTSVTTMVKVLRSPGPSPSRQARIGELGEAVRHAMDEIYPAYREVIELRITLGLGTAQIAARLGRNETAVRKLLSRAIGALREQIGEPARYLSRI